MMIETRQKSQIGLVTPLCLGMASTSIFIDLLKQNAWASSWILDEFSPLLFHSITIIMSPVEIYAKCILFLLYFLWLVFHCFGQILIISCLQVILKTLSVSFFPFNLSSKQQRRAVTCSSQGPKHLPKQKREF